MKKGANKDILSKIKKSRGISLDIGCGNHKRAGALGMDIRSLKGVDIIHDFNLYPWPIPDDVCTLITGNHVAEHVPKHGTPPQIDALVKLLIKKKVITKKEVYDAVGETAIFSFLMRFLDECWRISKVGGQVAFALPYAGSFGFYQDPSHTAPINEALWYYFDPEHQSGLWHIYKPMPWKIEMNTYQVNGNMEVLLSKRDMKKEYASDII
jgi:predicted SAM-dependent methyltransferase